jgi:uncharacterized alkaline shock family protein YloU
MKVIEHIVRIVVLAILVTAGGFVIFLCTSNKVWAETLDTLKYVRAEVLWVGAGFLLVGVLFGLTGYRRKKREKYLSFRNERGTVSISTLAISDYVSKLKEEFPGILRMKPDVRPAKNAVDILVDLRVRSGSQVHELCDLLQQRIRESLTNGLGISEIRRIEVSVKDIALEHKPN